MGVQRTSAIAQGGHHDIAEGNLLANADQELVLELLQQPFSSSTKASPLRLSTDYRDNTYHLQRPSLTPHSSPHDQIRLLPYLNDLPRMGGCPMSE